MKRTGAQPQAVDHNVLQLESRLPDVSTERVPAWMLVRRMVGLLVLTLIVLTMGAILAAAFVTVRMTVDALGMVEPATVIVARARQAGIISRVLVRTGDTVEANAPLVTLDSQAVATSILQLHAQRESESQEISRSGETLVSDSIEAVLRVEQSRVDLAKSQAGLRRVLSEFGLAMDPDSLVSNFVPGQHVALDAAALDVKRATILLASAQAQVARAHLSRLGISKQRTRIREIGIDIADREESHARLTVRASERGIVLTEDVHSLVGKSVTAGEVLVELGSPGLWKVVATVSERDVHRITVGDSAIIEIPAIEHDRTVELRGVVSSVALEQRATPEGAGYRVVLRLPDPGGPSAISASMRRGYVARVKVVTQSARLASVILERILGSGVER